MAGGQRNYRRCPRPYRKGIRARPERGLLADPSNVAGLLFGRDAFFVACRRCLPFLLRLVLRPAAGVTPDLG